MRISDWSSDVCSSDLLGVPSLALGAYFLFKFPDLLSGYQRRDFSMVQRVLTEGRVMLAYLHDLAVPSFSSASVFHDGFTISTGPLTPLSTLWSWMFIMGLLAIATLTRRSHPKIGRAAGRERVFRSV